MAMLDDARQGDRFAELLAQYESCLAGGATGELDASAIEADARLLADWTGAKQCLEMLARVKLHWSPLADK